MTTDDTPKGHGVGPRTPTKRVLVTGGGTGGHVYPAVAIADELRRRDPGIEFLYVGVRGRAEEKIVPRRGYPLRFVRARGWPGTRNPLRLMGFFFDLSLGLLKSLFILLTFRPHLIVGSGGYVSAPILLAAIVLRRLGLFRGATFVHEQNTFPGKLNRLVGARVDCVGVSFPETLRYFPRKGIMVGYPVRRELSHVDVAKARRNLKVPEGATVIFAFGGSQGARTINRTLVEALPVLLERPDLYIIHGTGTYKSATYDALADTEARLRAAGLGDLEGRYLHQAYFHNIDEVYAVADVVVCRTGAGTLTELAARGLPPIMIPKANLPGDHQVRNARVLAAAGAGKVLYERVALTEDGMEERVSGETLAACIMQTIDAPDELERMGKAIRAFHRGDALDRIHAILEQLMAGEEARAVWPVDPTPVGDGPHLEALTGPALVAYLERAWRSGSVELEPSDREYLQYRTDGYLASPDWTVRNRGVKLVGLLRYQERLPHLLFLINEKKPVSLPLRLLGGDFEQVGFIRRNIFRSIRQIDVINPFVIEAIEQGLEDPYFEVRSEAALSAAHFGDRLGDARAPMVVRLRRHLNERGFEGVVAAIKALGAIATDGAIIQDFQRFLYHKNWKIRQAVVEALAMLHTRGVLDAAPIRDYLDELLITSHGFQPLFPLKAAIQDLARLVDADASRQTADAVSAGDRATAAGEA